MTSVFPSLAVEHVVHDHGQLDPEWLRQRAAAGLDTSDEVWNGVVHVVPAPSGGHQRLGTTLAHHVYDRCGELGLLVSVETNVVDAERGLKDLRVPDLAVYRPEHAVHLGVRGRSELVVEIRSPGDETYEKFEFYARQQVQEVLVIEPDTRAFELYRLDGNGYDRVVEDAEGTCRVAALDLTLAAVETDDGPRLRITIDGEEAFA